MATISKLPSGKYRAQVRKAGVYKARTFDRKADATHWASDIERAIGGGGNAGTIRPPADMTLTMVIMAYLEQVQTGRTNRANLDRIADRIGGIATRNMSAVTVQEYVDDRLADGITGATMAGDLSALSSVLKWARHVRKLDIDPKPPCQRRQSGPDGCEDRHTVPRTDPHSGPPTRLTGYAPIWMGNPARESRSAP